MKKLGQFPASGEEARKQQCFYKITHENSIKVISGKKTPVLLEFFVSNDVVHVGEIIIPAGGTGPRQTEYDTHKGDALFFIVDGPLTFHLKESREVFQAESGESVFIPEGYEYKIINYTGKLTKAVFVIAPEL